MFKKNEVLRVRVIAIEGGLVWRSEGYAADWQDRIRENGTDLQAAKPGPYARDPLNP